MPEVSFGGLLVVALVAVLAPLLAGVAPRLRIPSPVLEILAGVILGPSVLGWLEIDEPLEILALLGLAFLLFLAGLEIDVRRLRGRVLRTTGLGYGVTLALGIAVGAAFAAGGWVGSPLIVAVALSATSLGLVVPVLSDAGESEGDVGQLVITSASMADFASVLLLSLLFSTMSRTAGTRLLLLGGFVVLVLAAAASLTRLGRRMGLQDKLTMLQDTTAEIRVRVAVVLFVVFVEAASRFGLEAILGAFLAGAVLGVADRDRATHPHFRQKLEAIGYGFLIPVFFVTSGVRLDVSTLLGSATGLALVPAFLAALLIVRGIPAALYTRTVGRRAALAAALLQATSLPFLVTAADIGVRVGELRPVTAAALVTAGLASVLVFPPVALALLEGPTCEEVVRILTDYLEDALSPQDRTRVQRHLRNCPGCEVYLDQLRTTIALAGELRAEEIPAAALDDLVRAFRGWRSATGSPQRPAPADPA